MNRNKQMAANLERLLAITKLNQVNFANAIGVHPVQVNRWLRGKSGMSVATARLIHKRFPGYSVDYLLGDTEYRTKEEEDAANALREAIAKTKLSESVNNLIDNCCEVNTENYITVDWNERTQEPEEAESMRFVLRRNGKEAALTLEQWNTLEKEICGYVAFRVEQICERGEW